ncbi:unnamed protein product [Colias eurytheme]|nr:unnamed protein product [Colias eurytheme]
MDNLFIIYDPSFLALVWPKIKNGVHLSLDRYCWTELSVFFKDYLDGHAWAYKTADASGRYSSSFFTGNKFWLGSKQQCQILNNAYESQEQDQTWGEFYSGDYLKTLLKGNTNFGRNQQDWHALVQRDELVRRLVRADNAPPFALGYSALRLQLNLTSLALAKSYDVILGVCLPRSCASEDIVSIINFSIMLNDHLKYNNSLSRSVKITSIRQLQGYDIKDDVVAVLTILITIIFILLSVIATLVDLDVFAASHQTLNLNKPMNKDEIDRKTITRPVIVDAVMKNANNAGTLKLCDPKLPPSITLGVVNMEGTGNCRRCGKYRKQCAISRQFDNFPPCPRMKYNSCASLNTEVKKTNGLMKDLLLSFSIKHSWMRVFNTNLANKDLSVIHAVKIIATFWIIFIHVAVTVSYVSNSGDINDPSNMYYNILATGTLAFDTLFFVSGIFSAHHFFYLKGRYCSEEVLRCSGPCGQLSQLMCFIINRAIRLLLPYVFAIFTSSVVSRALHASVTLGGGTDTCHTYWWRNLLYITNLYPREEQCMHISWYLSAETQLHACGAVLCALLATRKRLVLSLAVLLLFASTAFDVIATYTEDFVNSAGYAWEGHVWSHAAPYVLGVLTGWLVHRIDGLLTVPKMWSVSLWIWSCCAALGSWALPWAGSWGMGPVAAGWVTAWLHLLWPAAGIWPAVVCSTKYAYRTRQLLDSRAWCGISRLCYCALLLHMTLARALLAADTALCASFACLLCYYLGVTAVTLLCAFCLCVLVEMPTCAFLTRLSDYVYRR